MTETRITSATGGMKGSKECQPFWIDARALEALGEVAGYGSSKYAPHNYRKGVSVGLHINAAYRHLLSFQGGEDLDPESGLPHLAHCAWNVLAAWTQTLDHPEMDDRWGSSAMDWEQTHGDSPPIDMGQWKANFTSFLKGSAQTTHHPAITPEFMENQKRLVEQQKKGGR